jgi:hypothetical protein
MVGQPMRYWNISWSMMSHFSKGYNRLQGRIHGGTHVDRKALLLGPLSFKNGQDITMRCSDYIS